MNWGFVGFGRIALKFMESLKHADDETIYAIASRSNAPSIASQYPDVKIYDRYEDLFNDPSVDIVYVNTTHNFHKQNVIDALRGGKHVLCEKPIGLTVAEVNEMITVAKEKRRFLMEGLWSRFLPGYREAMNQIKGGAIGEVKYVRAEFAFSDVSHKERLYDPNLAGGSNYDVNIYNLALVHDIFGHSFSNMMLHAKKSSSGTDLSCSSILQFPEGKMAQLFSSIEMTCENAAMIYGTGGWLKMDQFWKCERFTVNSDEGELVREFPFRSNGYYHEIQAASHCVSTGELESPLMSWQHSLELAAMVEETEKMIKQVD